MSKYFFIAVIALIAYVSQVKTQASLPVYTVSHVYDGDTLTALDASNKEVRIRFICIDAPEKAQPTWGLASRDNLRKLLPVGAKFTVQSAKLDMYGRTLGTVFDSKNVNVNQVQVSSGFAVAYRKERGCESYLPLENAAKSKRLNIWSDPKFILPDEWRKSNAN